MFKICITIFFITSTLSFLAQRDEPSHHQDTIVTLLRQSHNGKSWDNSSKYTYTYDSDGNVTQILDQQWNEGWTDNYRESYTYKEGLCIEEHYERWIEQTWNNKYQYKYLRKYNKSGICTGFTDQRWENGTFKDFQEHTFTYDKKGNLISELVQTYNSGSLVNDELNTYAYNDAGQKIEYLHQRWYKSKEIWSNRTRHTYELNKFGLVIKDTEESWGKEAWYPASETSTTYNTQLLPAIVALKEGGYDSSSKFYEYSDNGLILSVITKYWSGEKGWVPDTKVAFEYKSK